MARQKQLPMPMKVDKLAVRADIPRWAADVVNAKEANDQVLKVWTNLRSCQKEALELRSKWVIEYKSHGWIMHIRNRLNAMNAKL